MRNPVHIYFGVVTSLIGNLRPVTSDFQDKIRVALNKTTEIIQQIHDRWELETFPNFLRSVAMNSDAWTILKVT